MSANVKMLRRLLFPPKCAACGVLLEAFCDERPRALCKTCAVKWDEAKNRPCHCCGLPVTDCTASMSMTQRHGVDSLIRLVEYLPDRKAEVQSRVIFKLKDRDNAELQAFLAAELAPLIQKQLLMRGQTVENTVLVWAPRSQKAVRRIGHDQSQRLCVALARELGTHKPVCYVRRAGGRVQKMLGQEQRAKNAFAAFEAVPKQCTDLKGKCVILVDDVATTGATLSAVAAKLRPYKPAHLIGVCVAVDVPPEQR